MVIAISLSSGCSLVPSLGGTPYSGTEVQDINASKTAIVSIHAEIPLATDTPLEVEPSYTMSPTAEISLFDSLQPGQYIAYSAIEGLDKEGYPITATYIISIEGEVKGKLLNKVLEEASPSPDSRRIAFVENRKLEIFDIVNNTQSTVNGGNECSSPSWSLDGEMLSVSCETGIATKSIYMLSLQEGERLTVINCSNPYTCYRPAWSPNGQWIAYVKGEGRSGVASLINGLYISSISCMEEPSSCEENTWGPFGWIEHFSWSPDSENLAVRSEPDTISILNIKSGESHKLIEQEDDIASLGWSPDGNWIAFDQSNDLYIASVDGGEPILLLRSTNAEFGFWLTVY